jgi:hypothetical protein
MEIIFAKVHYSARRHYTQFINECKQYWLFLRHDKTLAADVCRAAAACTIAAAIYIAFTL